MKFKCGSILGSILKKGVLPLVAPLVVFLALAMPADFYRPFISTADEPGGLAGMTCAQLGTKDGVGMVYSSTDYDYWYYDHTATDAADATHIRCKGYTTAGVWEKLSPTQDKIDATITTLGLGPTGTPQFAGIELTDVSDNTLTGNAGVLSIEGNPLAFKDATQTLTSKTIDGDDNTIQDLPYSAIKSTSRSGSDITLVTGTKGTNGNCAEWNGDGDLVGSGAACGTGGTPTEITVADESSDTTSFPAFFTDATGDRGPKTDASNLTYNAATGAFGAESFVTPAKDTPTMTLTPNSGSDFKIVGGSSEASFQLDSTEQVNISEAAVTSKVPVIAEEGVSKKYLSLGTSESHTIVDEDEMYFLGTCGSGTECTVYLPASGVAATGYHKKYCFKFRGGGTMVISPNGTDRILPGGSSCADDENLETTTSGAFICLIGRDGDVFWDSFGISAVNTPSADWSCVTK